MDAHNKNAFFSIESLGVAGLAMWPSQRLSVMQKCAVSMSETFLQPLFVWVCVFSQVQPYAARLRSLCPSARVKSRVHVERVQQPLAHVSVWKPEHELCSKNPQITQDLTIVNPASSSNAFVMTEAKCDTSRASQTASKTLQPLGCSEHRSTAQWGERILSGK